MIVLPSETSAGKPVTFSVRPSLALSSARSSSIVPRTWKTSPATSGTIVNATEPSEETRPSGDRGVNGGTGRATFSMRAASSASPRIRTRSAALSPPGRE